MHATFPLLRQTDFPHLKRHALDTLQVNLGYMCNQTCLHCHVNAGPSRKEIMERQTIDMVLDVLAAKKLTTLDLTGGAPEMNPHFRYLVAQARSLGVRVIDRCNLTILSEPGYDGLAQFLAEQSVEVTASLPCYAQANVDKQRGDGVFERSISALQQLNALGYGKPGSGLVLNLVFNPQGPVLPPSQEQLERDYKRELAEHFGIVFNHLFVIVNMPIQRFGSSLVSKGEFAHYMDLLKANYLEKNLDSVMCRTLISVDWQGYLYDCDFNQMLGMPARVGARPRAHLSQLLGESVDSNRIAIADHCYGCTAGQGSSCGGALA